MVRLPDGPQVPNQVRQSVPFQAPQTQPMGDATGQQLQRLGDATLRAGLSAWDAADAAQDEIDEARAKQAELALLDKADAEEGSFRGLLGGRAVEGYESAAAAFDKHATDAEGLLQNDTQKLLFGRLKAQHKVRYLSALRGHYTQQATNYAIGQSQARVQKWEQKVAADPTDQEAKAALRGELENLSDYYGDSPEEREQRRTKSLTAVHDTYIQGRLEAEDVDSARKHIEQFGDEMNPEARAQAKRAIDRETTKQRAQQFGIEMVSAVAERPQGPGGVPLALDPDKVRADAMQRLQQAIASDPAIAADLALQNRAEAQIVAVTEAIRQQNATQATQVLRAFEAWYEPTGPQRREGELPRVPTDFPGWEILQRHGLDGAARGYAGGAAFGWKADNSRMWGWRSTPMKGWSRERFYATWRPVLDDRMMSRADAKWQLDNGITEKPDKAKLVSDSDRIRGWLQKWGSYPTDETAKPKDNYLLHTVTSEIEDRLRLDPTKSLEDVIAEFDEDIVSAGSVENALTKERGGAPYYSLPQEDRDTATVQVFDANDNPVTVALGDISRDMFPVLDRMVADAGLVKPGETPTMEQRARAWVHAGMQRPYAGTPGETVGLPSGGIVGKDALLDDPEGYRRLDKIIPPAVLSAVRAQYRGGINIEENAANMEWLWNHLGKPQTPDEFNERYAMYRSLGTKFKPPEKQ